MPLYFRRALYISFISLFLILTPLLILYANGYQFSLSKKNFVKTGMFILDSLPRGAKIFLDGKLQSGSGLTGKQDPTVTPAKIKGLLPGIYLVKMELDGYWSWEKKMPVNPGASTYAEDVIMFKKNLPGLIVPSASGSIDYSADISKALVRDDATAWIVDLFDPANPMIKLDLAASTSPIVLWSPSGSHLIAGGSLFDLSAKTPLADRDFKLPANTAAVAWNQTDDNAVYYLDEKNRLVSYDLDGREVASIAFNVGRPAVRHNYDFQASGNNLYYVESDGNKSFFNSLSLSTGKIIKSLELPEASRFRLINPGHNLVNLLDRNKKVLILIDPLSSVSNLVESLENVTLAKWISENKLLYANDYEIWIYDISTRQKRLLTRISDRIDEIFWHPSDNYVIYSTGSSIVVIELDERDKNTRTELFSGSAISSIRLNRAGSALYFRGSIGNQTGLFRLDI